MLWSPQGKQDFRHKNTEVVLRIFTVEMLASPHPFLKKDNCFRILEEMKFSILTYLQP